MKSQKDGDKSFRKSLRNAAINYRNGWFFVTCQVAHNKSIFGAIVGEQCVLNDFGRKVEAYWRELPAKYPELELDEFVLMPNHFHAIVRIHYLPTNKEQHLGFLVSRFKGGTGYIYGKLRRAGALEDIGDHLWQFDYWDKIVTDERQLAALRKYIRENPKNWSRDRFGAVTQYSFGNLELLRGPRIAFVASQGFWASELKPRLIWREVNVRGLRSRLPPRNPPLRYGPPRRCGGRIGRHHIGAGGFSPHTGPPTRHHIHLHECTGARGASPRARQGAAHHPGDPAGHPARKLPAARIAGRLPRGASIASFPTTTGFTPQQESGDVVQ